MYDSTTTAATNGPIHFLNVEYFLRLLYDLLFVHSGLQGGVHVSGVIMFVGVVWGIVTAIAYLVSLLALLALAFYSIRLRETRTEDAKKYTTVTHEAAEKEVEHSRWAYIQQLIESGQESDWRQAIIEADIMLEDTLRRVGFPGETVGDQLRSAAPERFRTLRDAGEAHGVRNRIAHDGSSYELTNHVAYQTIQKYRNVFEEFGEI